MVTVNLSGLKELSVNLKKKFLTIQDKDKVIRTVATTLCAEIKTRIHEKGLNSAGSAIGSYDEKYLELRQRKYGRISDKKVIISLEGALENDFAIGEKSPIKTENGWGLGFKNDFNYDKSKWMEEKYGPIWSLTSGEKDNVKKISEFEVSKILKGK